jgi:hypothetical protein
MECPTAETLLEDYVKATRGYVDAAIKLFNLVRSQEGLIAAKRHAAETFAKCEAAPTQPYPVYQY